MISVSAVGFYDYQKIYDEEHNLPASIFFGDLCSDWETIAMRASKHTRVVVFRLGVVLGRNGGMVKKIRPLFRAFLGTIPGNGNQYLSWIHISDVVNAFRYAMKNKEMKGIYNLTTPNPVTQHTFLKKFAQQLNRPCFMKIPGKIIRFIMGEGAMILLDGQQVMPTLLTEAGFHFKHPENR